MSQKVGWMPKLLRTVAMDFDCAQPLVASLELKLHFLALAEPVKIQPLQGAPVKKYFLTIFGANEAEASVADQSFNSTRHVSLACIREDLRS